MYAPGSLPEIESELTLPLPVLVAAVQPVGFAAQPLVVAASQLPVVAAASHVRPLFVLRAFALLRLAVVERAYFPELSET